MNNPENSLTTKTGDHIPCGYLMSAILAFDNVENIHSLYREEYCMKKFCILLREQAANEINLEKKKMLPLTEKELKLHQHSTVCYICRNKFTQKLPKD